MSVDRNLSLNELRKANTARCQRWHSGATSDWMPLDWSNATAGEVGEICNLIKKLRRIETGTGQWKESDAELTPESLTKAIGEEIADALLYLDLLADSLDIDLSNVVVRKFNAVSDAMGFPEKLLPEGPVTL